MSKVIRLFFLLFFIPSICLGAVPKLFFSDMTDGPTDGWEGSATKGAAVSVWGLDFGTAVHTSYITCAGQTIYADEAGVAEWAATTNPTTARGLQRITFYLNSSMSAGAQTISVTTADGTSSTVPFYTRSTGNIYFVKTDGNDGADGLSVANAWATFGKARAVADAGDVVYFKSGTWTAYDDGSTWANAVLYFRTNASTSNHNNGTANNSITFASYPGEVAQMCNGEDATGGNATSGVYRHGDGVQDALEYWTLSKFKGYAWHYVFKWSNIDLTYDDNLRIVGWDATTTIPRTDIDTPESLGGQILSQNGDQDNVYILGNWMHHSGLPTEADPTNYGYKVQSIYISGFNGQYSNINIAWNDFDHNSGNVQIYGHNAADVIDDIYIHDNIFQEGGTTGMVLGGGDGASAYSFVTLAYIYNNIFTGNDSYAAKLSDGSTGSHGGTYHFYNNTTHNNISAEINSVYPTALYVKNNIFQTAAAVYFSYAAGDGAEVSGNNNLFYGSAGSEPAWSSDGIMSDPLLDASYIPSSASPAIGAGTDLSAVFTTDYLGETRTTWDIGAIGAAKNVTLSGTAITGGVTEDEIVAGGQTIIFTVGNDEFVATLCADNATTTAFMASCTSNGAEAGGWDAQMTLVYTDCSRDSATQVTWTLPATAGYTISINETITCVIPADVFVGAESITASPTMPISNIIVPEVINRSGGYSSTGGKWQYSSTGAIIQ